MVPPPAFSCAPLPACKAYRLAGNYNIEMYGPPAEKPEDTYSEIRIPIEKVRAARTVPDSFAMTP